MDNEKSHVSLERHLCLVCGVGFETGAILLDRRLRARMQRHAATGWGLAESIDISEARIEIESEGGLGCATSLKRVSESRLRTRCTSDRTGVRSHPRKARCPGLSGVE